MSEWPINLNQLKTPEKESPEAIDFRAETNQKIEELLKSNTDLKRVAILLGAEKYLEVIQVKGASPAYQFNVKRFVDDQITQKTFLKLPGEFLKTDEVILPPDPGEIIIGSGEGIDPKKIIPRSQFMVELMSEMNLDYNVIEGENSPNMMRGLSYYAFIIQKINKLALINNEEGNATFVIHQFKGGFEEVKDYLEMSKEELKSLPQDVFSELIYPGDKEKWKMAMRDILENGAKIEIEKEFNEYNKAPEGWITNKGLATLLKKSFKTISVVANKYKESNPEWFKHYLNKINSKREHYSPELVEKIKRDLSEYDVAPEGWMTNHGVVTSVGGSERTIAKIASSYKKSNPGWFKDALNKDGIRRKFYSPELVTKIKEELSNYELASEGWMTNYGLANLTGGGEKIIAKIANDYRKNNPKWFNIALDKGRHKREHYSPKLVEIIKKELSTIKDNLVLENWKTMNSLSVLSGRSCKIIAEIADKYRESNPEWFKFFLDKRSVRGEYYSPELVEIIKKELEAHVLAPEGWKIKMDLNILLKKSYEVIEKIVDSYRKNNPEWFRPFLDKSGKMKEYYSPELVEKIKEELKNNKE